MRNLVALLLVALSAVGCSPDRVKMASADKREPFTGEVLVFEGALPPGVKATTIGRFNLEKNFYGSTSGMKRNVADVAGPRGANGALVTKQGQRMGTWSWAAPYVEGDLLWIENYDLARAGGAAAKPSTEARLREVDDLHAKGLISDVERDQRRQAILATL